MVAITGRFPAALPGLTRLAQVFTLLKFAGISLGILIVVALAIRNRGTINEA
jgi:hypothetical protein